MLSSLRFAAQFVVPKGVSKRRGVFIFAHHENSKGEEIIGNRFQTERNRDPNAVCERLVSLRRILRIVHRLSWPGANWKAGVT
jgi:hypothetical protein